MDLDNKPLSISMIHGWSLTAIESYSSKFTMIKHCYQPSFTILRLVLPWTPSKMTPPAPPGVMAPRGQGWSGNHRVKARRMLRRFSRFPALEDVNCCIVSVSADVSVCFSVCFCCISIFLCCILSWLVDKCKGPIEGLICDHCRGFPCPTNNLSRNVQYMNQWWKNRYRGGMTIAHSFFLDSRIFVASIAKHCVTMSKGLMGTKMR